MLTHALFSGGRLFGLPLPVEGASGPSFETKTIYY